MEKIPTVCIITTSRNNKSYFQCIHFRVTFILGLHSFQGCIHFRVNSELIYLRLVLEGICMHLENLIQRCIKEGLSNTIRKKGNSCLEVIYFCCKWTSTHWVIDLAPVKATTMVCSLLQKYVAVQIMHLFRKEKMTNEIPFVGPGEWDGCLTLSCFVQD